ncbi:1-acyl-sn-glycerol-3-phosphate acyltransferase [Streptococcus suis]|uniref:1-acyl-sn-glycerol-3-phosphate acyltransferase n=1 Tax=Streptococcus suis TaxID=1307 RepID=A0A0Z8G6E1_STRSU|nr:MULTISPECIES: 1-acyl-sn-glycerol-3-phosphate acyltransferase [Streptococcus]AER21524.1 1-acyl-sn-glycerol-3-phosphate acyltransferase [Streptococcus suis ST1]AGL48052.1 1-acyl-sn-glycerol-3-phosphate acyltransferase [Streptococcus suis TL13]AUA18717.1 1-acyl-sn-glycerol-3-phosphate acyltransferase [Streptococcus suis]AWL25661.1 1-acyl-sn-glycerol-3-phosphate acyltransferase [Streptococcus suis]AXI66102.1 1-acyl-sn-glycerol-3-phosphate acyltransferase [Streptococcus suis]
MFYSYLRTLLTFLLWAINGNIHYHDREKILPQEENYILIAPHKTFWDPVFLGYAAAPKQFIFMAKKELFKDRGFGWWISKCGAFPIDRDNPGMAAIKYPVNMLKKSDRSLVMFPSGSRHSSELKGGVAVIAKSAKVKLMPATYVGPMTIKGLLAGERIDVAFGNPIDVSDIKRMDDAGTAEVTSRIEAEFKRLDDHAASFQTKKKPNILTYIYRIPVLLLVALILGLTYAFSYIASFFWQPSTQLDKK